MLKTRNIKLTLEYDGTNYCGWQVQNHPASKSLRRRKKSIQEVLEKALSKILRKKVATIVSGRTDAGVHALGQVANFKTNSKIPPVNLQNAINSFLPDDISVIAAQEVPSDFHSRFDAKTKIYRYNIINRPFPAALLRNQVLFHPYPLDFKRMQQEARVLEGRHNFKSFQASEKRQKSTVRTIKRISVAKKGDLIYIDIEGSGFLYNMVRNIVGTLIEVGRGKFPKGCLKTILRSRNRKLAGPTAPARGLCLLAVNY